MFCSNCGKELPAEAKFCPACGTGVTGKNIGESHSAASQAKKVVPSKTRTPVIRLKAVIQVKSFIGFNEGYAGNLIASDSEIWFEPWAYGAVLHVIRLWTSPWNIAKDWRLRLEDILDVRVCPNIVNCSIKVMTRDRKETEFVVGLKGRFLEKAESFCRDLRARIEALT